jgi:hypothetical protein
MPELKVLRTVLDGANALVITLIGRNTVDDSRGNAARLCERMHREERTGLIMDYRRCALDHTVAQFAEIAEIFVAGMPKGARIAYVYGQANFMHAATMTKQLAKAGFPARAFSDFDDAAEFVRQPT